MTTQSFYVRKIQADINNLKQTVAEVLGFYDSKLSPIDDSIRLELKIVLNELLINAIKHGGRDGGACNIKVVAGITADFRAILVIEDDGEGYDTALAPGRIKPKRMFEYQDEIVETGRGIFIVKSLCDEFMVNEKGNKVVINKRLDKTS